MKDGVRLQKTNEREIIKNFSKLVIQLKIVLMSEKQFEIDF